MISSKLPVPASKELKDTLLHIMTLFVLNTKGENNLGILSGNPKMNLCIMVKSSVYGKRP